MKIKFYIDHLNIPNVSCSQLLEPLGWVLTDNSYDKACDEILNEISNVRSSKSQWEMSYNKSVLCLDEYKATCIDAFNEARIYSMSLQDFEKLLKNWKRFLLKPGANKESIFFLEK